ncbi:hypothetical protein [Aeromonas veronii]|uniref:hypothetical protein n=1 Tax=Aeromonas veronii TaxID=654 RepID=UPI00301E4A75
MMREQVWPLPIQRHADGLCHTAPILIFPFVYSYFLSFCDPDSCRRRNLDHKMAGKGRNLPSGANDGFQ